MQHLLPLYLIRTIRRLAFLLALAGAARPVGAQQISDQFHSTPNTPKLTGHWGGLRDTLSKHGVDFFLEYKGEAAGNLTGGTANRFTEVGQAYLSVAANTEKLFGWKGNCIRASVTKRHGPHLGQRADLDVLMLVQEVYGRGPVWRYSELWVQQILADSQVVVKAGRIASSEFATSDSEFMNLAFVGAPPGNIIPNYWVVTPIATWMGWVKFRARALPTFYLKPGLQEDNRNNLDEAFFVSRGGARGVISFLELGWTPTFGGGQLPGRYRLGGWRNSSADDDVLLGTDGRPRTGAPGDLPAMQRGGQTGFYVQGQQQFTGKATEDVVTGKITRQNGLNGFFDFVRTDARTAQILDQQRLGFYYNALFKARPKDQMGIAFARTHFNPRAADALLLADPTSTRRESEFESEIYYGLNVTAGLLLRPSVQYIVRPGGRRTAPNVLVAGLRFDVSF